MQEVLERASGPCAPLQDAEACDSGAPVPADSVGRLGQTR